MRKQSLNGSWRLEIIGKDAGLLPEGSIPAKVPGTVYGALLEQKLIPDPYFRDNELKVLPLMENDFCFSKTFEADGELLGCDRVVLRFDGLDTLADVYVNQTLVGSAENMHRIWEYDLTQAGCLEAGKNELRVVLHSPTKYIKEENGKVYTGGAAEAMAGFPHLRKAHCMFGWDWGPRLPDAGIFREVSLLGIEQSRLTSVYVTQEHEPGRVTLNFEAALETFAGAGDEKLKITLLAPEGGVLSVCEKTCAAFAAEGAKIAVDAPRLWWPRGYGEQPLYRVIAELLDSKGRVLDVWDRRIGLRTMKVNTKPDRWGTCFAHEVNSVKIFAMGADYVPEDNLLGRVSKERTRRLLESAVWANHNCIRVWGGGYYPDDAFYDICDELGLIVWQDFMFACASYELDEAFEENVSREITDNVRRIRHHACLGLWCGNNEMELQVLEGVWKSSLKQKYDYIKLYEYIIPKIMKKEDPAAFYWPSSPSSGGNFDNPSDDTRGDVHYWDVWHGNKPITEYRKFRFRYLSEFGFQSFPCKRTVESFTEPGDRNIFSRVMEMHQRNCAANGKIMNYLSATYLYPKDFDHLLYASQLLQADAIRYGVEHFRRFRGQCMGTVVWQLNDIWPVASWSGIDYYGRWKALHYAERRMFAPVMISCEEKGEVSERPFCTVELAPIEKSARLHVANETMREVHGTVFWSLRLADSSVLVSGESEVCVPPQDGVWLDKLDFGGYEERKVHLSYRFEVNGETVSENSCLFTPPKHYYFADPHLRLERKGNSITVHADAYAKNVEILGLDGDLWLSDNFFDMEAGERTVEILDGEAGEIACRSVYDIG